MSFAALGSLGTANDHSVSRTLTLTLGSAVPTGDLIVVWYGDDSIYSVFEPSNGHNRWRCSDSQGNFWSNVGCNDDGQGFFYTGSFGAIFITQVTTALSAGDTIQVEGDVAILPGTPNSKAMSVERFSMAAGKRWACYDPFQSDALVAVPIPNTPFTTLVSYPWLWLYCLSVEGPITDSYTFPSDWTEITPDGTNTGTPTDDITILGAYKIATSSSESIHPSNNTANRDFVWVMQTISEVDSAPFPQTGILDNFTRADENPLANGTWDQVNQCWGGALAQLKSNQAAGAGGSQWLGNKTNCLEVYCTATVATEQIHVLHALTGGSGGGGLRGRITQWIAGRTGDGQAWFDYMRVSPVGFFGGASRPSFYPALTMVNGTKFGTQRTRGPSTIFIDHVWADTGGGWVEIGATWVIQYGEQTSGQLGLAFILSNARADDFGGGTVADCPGHTQHLLPIMHVGG